MNPIQNCLQMAAERKAQEILLRSQQPLRLRIGKDLLALSTPQMSAQETRQMLSHILTEEEKKALYEQMKIQGAKTIGNISFKFDFQIDFDGVNGSLTLQNSNTQLWNFPVIVTESSLKAQGLNLIVGPRRSGKTAAIQQILASAKNRKKVIAVYSDGELQNLPEEGNVLSSFSVSHLQQNGVQKSADVVLIDSTNLSVYETALRLSEEGRSVVLTMPFWHIGMGLQRLVDLTEGSLDSRARRISSTLQMALGLRILPGVETPLQGAFELLLGDSEIQAAIREMDFGRVSSLMRTSAEKTGMRSLNQTLFQLLMKRKIELKAAFEASSEPEELDGLLKKVGI